MFWLAPDDLRFPPVHYGPADAPLAVGGDLSAARLVRAYSLGIFPWYNEPPILWWSPDPRMVLAPNDLRINRSLRRALRTNTLRVSFDTAFPAVIRACAAPRKDQAGTWITTEIIAAYEELFALGFAHSVECWSDGHLVGGVYGVAIGGAFFGESMFSTVNNASKIAFVELVAALRERGFALIDCQVASPHMAALGASAIARSRFLAQLEMAIALPIAPGSWRACVGISS
ncbi:MAG TPA: leucyl/phenylalanyl-tRNA--protein transferase [Acidiferrobacter sp.]|nr:leucyl/phenylalanyl-tRNA--protein transferase [Acidiferrobacter sp.]